MDSLAAAALPKIRDFATQCLGNFAWAVARCEVLPSPLLPAISARAIALLRDFEGGSRLGTEAHAALWALWRGFSTAYADQYDQILRAEQSSRNRRRALPA